MAPNGDIDYPESEKSNSISGHRGIDKFDADNSSAKPNTSPQKINADWRSQKKCRNIRERILDFLFERRSFELIYFNNIPENANLSLVKQLYLNDIEEIADFSGVSTISVECESMRRRFGSGCECYALKHKQENMIALTWVYRIQYRIGNGLKALVLRPGEALIADTNLGGSTDRDKSRQLEEIMAALLKHQGVKALVFSDPDNRETPVYTIYRIKIIGFTFTRIKVNAAFYPLSFR
jgi:hypothetical protein